jgi:hypothetical protein
MAKDTLDASMQHGVQGGWEWITYTYTGQGYKECGSLVCWFQRWSHYLGTRLQMFLQMGSLWRSYWCKLILIKNQSVREKSRCVESWTNHLRGTLFCLFLLQIYS